MSFKLKALTFLAAVAALSSMACHDRTDEKPGVSVTIPSDEVWVTSRQIREASIATSEVTTRPIGNALATTGKISFSDARISHVFSPVTGRVSRLLATLGDHVAAGTALATIQSPEVGAAASDLEKSEADLAAARNDFDRQRELYDAHAAARRDLEAAENVYRKAVAERDRAAQKSRLLSKSGHGATQEFVLRAPIDGNVVARNIGIGMEVQGQYSGGTAPELFTIGNIDPVWIFADVFEIDLSRVHLGAPTTVTVVSYPGHRFTGVVDWISGSLDPATRSAKVRCTIRNSGHMLLPEMYANVEITTDTREKLVIPRAAVSRVGDQLVAFVDKGPARDGRERFARRIVAIDENEAGDLVPVLGGLAPGERVVSSGALILTGSGA